MAHLMIDIETLDTANTAVVTQVGWVVFDEEILSPPRELVLDIQEQLDLGRTISASTLRFWMEQPDIARQKVFCNDNPNRLQELGASLRTAISNSKIEHIWSHGPHFDVAILQSLLGNDIINYRMPRDTRTLAMLAPHAVHPQPVTKHSAGAGAYAQAWWVRNIWKEIGYPEVFVQ